MPKNIHHLTILQDSNKSNENESSKNPSPVTNTVTSSTTMTNTKTNPASNTNVINNPNPATKSPSNITLNKTNIEPVTDVPKKASLPGYSTFNKLFF